MSDAAQSEGGSASPVEPMLEEDEAELASSIVGVDEAREKMRTQKISRKLWSAIQADDTDELEELLKQGADMNTISGNYRQLTPLQQAIDDDNFVSTVILLEHGADPNIPSGSVSSPLHLAVQRNSIEMIRLLLHKGANPNATDRSHQTPLHRAADDGRLEVVSYLLSRDDVDIDIPDNTDRTVLHDACAKGWVDVVEKLLAKGASVEAQDKEERTPIFDASLNGEIGVLDLLLAAGASIDARDDKGRTPIFDAAAGGNIAVVEKLIAKGASVNVEDESGKSLLHFVSAHDRDDVVRVLVGHGASVNKPARDGSTPLHEALRYGAIHAAEQLIRDHGAEVAVQNTAAGGNQEPKILQPSWDKLFHLPDAGRLSDKVDLSVSGPADGSVEKSVCEGFEGAVWPWPPVPFVLSTPTVQNLLYSTPSPLTATRERPGATWIHIPANNRTWIEDAFKALYAPGHIADPPTPAESENETGSDSDVEIHVKTNPKKIDQVNSEADRRRKLLSILSLIRSEFSDNRTKALRPIPVDREIVYRYDRRTVTTRIQKDQMFSVAFPILDIDMRQPYFDPEQAQALEKGTGVGGKSNGGTAAKKQSAEKPGDSSYTQKIKETTVDEGGPATKVEEDYTNLMDKLRSTYKHVDPPISLDKYFHESIDVHDLNVRNGDQVISRFIARQRVEKEHNEEHVPEVAPAGGSGAQSGNTKTPNQQPDASQSSTPSQLEAGLGRSLTNEERLMAETDGFRQKIITVPRFWIWKVDEKTIVTSFPQRWDEKSLQGGLPRSIWTSLMEKLLSKQSESKSEAQLPANELMEEIVAACLQFKPSFRLMGQEYNYPDAFAAEIAFVSREVTKLYNEYKISLGKSVEDFSKSIKLATEYLITVDDILNEITMIRRVYRDQGRIMLNMKTGSGPGKISPAASLDYNTAEWGYEGMRSTEDKHLIARLKHLEKDAHMVRKSITTLLDLRQRQVTVEMALSSEVQSGILFKQSSILLIFTLATVLFAPLSWVSSLMALKIDNFTPDSWPQARVVGASFGSVLGTVALCLVGLGVYLAQQNYLIKKKTPV